MKRFTLYLVVLAGMSLAACASRSYYASSPPPAYRVEVRTVAPRAGMVWVDGYWGWQNRNYAWVPGRWASPPRSRTVWVAPRWELRGGRYRFNKGRWR